MPVHRNAVKVGLHDTIARMVGANVKKHPVGVFSEAASLQGWTFHHPANSGRVLLNENKT